MNEPTRFVISLSLVLSASSLESCKNQDRDVPEPPRAQGSAPLASAHAATPRPAASAAEATGPAGSAAVVPTPSGELIDSSGPYGTWIEAPQYKFRVTKVERCASGGDSGADGALLLGASVQILAKIDEVFAAPRDVTLQKQGVIFPSEIEPAAGVCGAPLKPRQLRRGETASGVVIFKLPERSYARGAGVVFQPTRWGGATTVRFELPECLDACGDARAAKRR